MATTKAYTYDKDGHLTGQEYVDLVASDSQKHEVTGSVDKTAEVVAQLNALKDVVSDEVLLKIRDLEQQQERLEQQKEQERYEKTEGQNLSVGDVVRHKFTSYGTSMGVVTMMQDQFNVTIDWCAKDPLYYPSDCEQTYNLERAPLHEFVIAMQKNGTPENTPYKKGDPVCSPNYYPGSYGVIQDDQAEYDTFVNVDWKIIESAAYPLIYIDSNQLERVPLTEYLSLLEEHNKVKNEDFKVGDPVYSPLHFPDWYGVVLQDQEPGAVIVRVDWKVCADIPPSVDLVDEVSPDNLNYPLEEIDYRKLSRIPLSEYLHVLQNYQEEQEQAKKEKEREEQEEQLRRMKAENEALQQELAENAQQTATLNMSFEQVLKRLDELENKEQTPEVMEEMEALEQTEVMPVLHGMSKMQIAIKLAAAVGKGIGKGVVFRLAQSLGNQFGVNVESLIKFFIG